jgi:hypothetical protein
MDYISDFQTMIGEILCTFIYFGFPNIFASFLVTMSYFFTAFVFHHNPKYKIQSCIT